jgi:hypothetical protein
MSESVLPTLTSPVGEYFFVPRSIQGAFGDRWTDKNEFLCRRFLTGDSYGLKATFANLWSFYPIGPDGQRMRYEIGCEFRQKKSLEMFEAISNGTLAENASEMEKGLLLMSLSCVYSGSGGDRMRSQELKESAINTMRSGGSLEHQTLFVENLRVLCEVMNEIDKANQYGDRYGIMDNRSIYETLLFNEARRLQKMRKESPGQKRKEEAFRGWRKAIQTLKKLGLVSEGQW